MSDDQIHYHNRLTDDPIFSPGTDCSQEAALSEKAFPEADFSEEAFLEGPSLAEEGDFPEEPGSPEGTAPVRDVYKRQVFIITV